MDVPVSLRCINCLCQVATGCNDKIVCRGDFCGAFGLTKHQWVEAGSPISSTMNATHPKAYELCATNIFCSYYIIEGYIEKHQRDCNGDGQIDCDDFVAIFRLGLDNCHEELPENYQGRYEYCQGIVPL